MANAGDSYFIILQSSHLDWGEYRNTFSRDSIPGEAYIPIPIDKARKFGLFNSNGTNYRDILGQNLFNYTTSDDFQRGILRAQGASIRGSIYAKQFSADKDLKKIGRWFDYIGAKEGTRIKVEWTSPYDIVLSVY